MLHKLTNFLAGLIIFLAPTHFFLKLTEQSAFVNGLRVDYLIPKLFAVDILIVLYILLTAHQGRSGFSLIKLKDAIRSHPVALGALFVSLTAVLIGTLWPAPISGGWYLLQAIVLLILGAFLYREHDAAGTIFPAMALAAIFQSAIGIAQFVRQQSLFGYQLLGEPNIANSIGLAKTSIQGSELILPYGTTPHPNVLGGFLAVYILALLGSLLNRAGEGIVRKLFYTLAVILGGIALILTFSISAWAIIVIGSLLLIKKLRGKLAKWLSERKVALSAIIVAVMILTPVALNLASRFTLLDDDSVLRRDYLNRAAAAMFLDNPIMGTGLNSYTKQVERYSSEREVVRFVQPAHHVGLLWLAETGIAGIIFAASAFYLLLKKGNGGKLLAGGLLLLPALVLDHYLLSMHQGILLTVLVMTIIMPTWLSQKNPA